MNKNTLMFLIALCFFLAILRVWGMHHIPLMDTTEARYAEIARIMSYTGDWITPWFNSSTPFWGKPPLSFWATALSFNIFGISEITARVPHFICSLLVLFVTWYWTREYSMRIRIYSILILSSSSLFYIGSGMVMTDMWLLLSTTLVLYGFWGIAFGSYDSRRSYTMLMFFGFGLGMLAKGPVAIVLTVLPMALWVIIGRHWIVLKNIFWTRGLVLASVIFFPWYILAEIKTPGFLEYFILGEHIYRFVIPGWDGDLYGNAHDEPYGTIWMFLIVGLFPWSILLVISVIYKIYTKRNPLRIIGDGKVLFLIFWSASPCLFFTFAGNVLWPYVITALPTIALMIALLTSNIAPNRKVSDAIVISVFTMTFLTYATSSYLFLRSGTPDQRSQKQLVKAYQKYCNQDQWLGYHKTIPFSAQFYSKGRVEKTTLSEEGHSIEATPGSCIAIRSNSRFGNGIVDYSMQIGEYGRYTLYKVND